jgi:hypothetical protein
MASAGDTSSASSVAAAPSGPPGPTTGEPVAGAGPDGGATPQSSPVVQAANPTTIRIPGIGVEASMIPLGLRGDGTIEVPDDFDQTGWWVDGPEPGETGPAVVLGHVDSRQGPAVFFELRDLQPGEAVHIDRMDGSTVTYVVDRVERHPKTDFPTEAVYGPTTEPVLRLVTCGGSFDRSRRSYDDNIIVFAHLAS